MLNTKKIEEIVQSITNSLPSGITALQADIEKNVRSTISATFAKLDLVTREEFDIQTQVLHRTREKLEALAQRVVELESTSKN